MNPQSLHVIANRVVVLWMACEVSMSSFRVIWHRPGSQDLANIPRKVCGRVCGSNSWRILCFWSNRSFLRNDVVLHPMSFFDLFVPFWVRWMTARVGALIILIGVLSFTRKKVNIRMEWMLDKCWFMRVWLSRSHSWIHESGECYISCTAEAMRKLGGRLRKDSAEGFIVSGASAKTFWKSSYICYICTRRFRLCWLCYTGHLFLYMP